MLRGKPHIMQMIELYEEEDLIIFITELLEGGDLYQYIKENKTISEKDASCVFLQLLEALREMQSKNIVHRDLKLDNIFISETNL